MIFKVASVTLNLLLLVLLTLAVLSLRSAGQQLEAHRRGLDRANEYIARLQEENAEAQNEYQRASAMLSQCQGLILNRQREEQIAQAAHEPVKGEIVLPPAPHEDLGSALLRLALKLLM